MKAGLTITEMAAEIERQAAVKADYLVNPQKLEMESLGGTPMLRVVDGGVDQMEPLSVQETAHRQLGTHLGIPWKYYEKMLQQEPDLLSYNVNHWLHKGEPAPRMLRTLDGKAMQKAVALGEHQAVMVRMSDGWSFTVVRQRLGMNC